MKTTQLRTGPSVLIRMRSTAQRYFFIKCALACLVLQVVAVGCLPISAKQPRDFVEMLGPELHPFIYPRSVFQPGTIVRLDKDGNVVASPIGLLAECMPDAVLTPSRGEGISGQFLSDARRGVRLDIRPFQKLLPLRLKAGAGAISYAKLTINGSYSLLLSQITIQQNIDSQWGKMSAPCRTALRASEISILSEVIYATKGTRLQFVQADGARAQLSAQEIENIGRSVFEAQNIHVDGEDVVFDSELPLAYSAMRPSLPMSSCPFSLKAVNDARYVDCVRALAQTERDSVLVEAARALRREFSATTSKPQSTFRPDDFISTNALITFLLAIDGDNGHGLYYNGTVRRWLYKENRFSEEYLRSNEPFLRYLQIEGTLTTQDRNGNAEACYSRAHGYCGERTAWILHSLANDFYRLGMKETNLDRRRSHCEKALGLAKRCLKISECVFDQATQGVPTKELETRLQNTLGHP